MSPHEAANVEDDAIVWQREEKQDLTLESRSSSMILLFTDEAKAIRCDRASFPKSRFLQGWRLYLCDKPHMCLRRQVESPDCHKTFLVKKMIGKVKNNQWISKNE